MLDALANGTTLAAALGEGGLFEGLLAETRTLYRDENYDGYADVKNGKRLVSDAKAGQAWGLRNFKTHVQLGTTDYTRFGVSWAKVNTESFAYSPLPQVEYETNASGAVVTPGYPGGSKATYSGSTVFREGTVPYEGTVDVDVSWDADKLGDSVVTVTFSELAKVADSEPFSIGYILVNNTGQRYLRNGLPATVDSTTGRIDYHAYETGLSSGAKYKGIDDTQQVAGHSADTTNNPVPDPAIETVPATDSSNVTNAQRDIQLSKDPRNGFADMVRFDVDKIVFRSNITVSTDDDDMLTFATSGTTTGTQFARADVDIVWADTSFNNTTLTGINGNSGGSTDKASTGAGGGIEGEFVGQGADGPLAAMGVWQLRRSDGRAECRTPWGQPTLQARDNWRHDPCYR